MSKNLNREEVKGGGMLKKCVIVIMTGLIMGCSLLHAENEQVKIQSMREEKSVVVIVDGKVSEYAFGPYEERDFPLDHPARFFFARTGHRNVATAHPLVSSS